MRFSGWRVMPAWVAVALSVAGCSTPDPLISFSDETATVCAPAQGASKTAWLAMDQIRNLTPHPVRVVNVELDEPHGLELLGYSVHENGCVGPKQECVNDSPEISAIPPQGSINVTPYLALELRPSQASQGWAKGVWVTVESSTGERVSHHSCITVSSAPVSCNPDITTVSVEGREERCNKTRKG